MKEGELSVYGNLSICKNVRYHNLYINILYIITYGIFKNSLSAFQAFKISLTWPLPRGGNKYVEEEEYSLS